MRTLLFLSAALTSAAHAQTFSVLAWYNQNYASLPGGGHLLSGTSNEVSIAPDGTVAFPAIVLQQGIFRSTPLGPAAIASVGDPAPGSGGYNFSGFSPPRAAPGGAVFVAGLRGIGLPDVTAVYLADAAGLHLCLLTGQPVPGHPGLIVRSFPDLAVNGSLVSIMAQTGTATTTTGTGLWQGPAGAMALIAHTGDVATGMPAGRTFTTFYAAPSITATGLNAFDATATGNNDGLWSGAPLSLLHQAGEPIATMPGATFAYVWDPVLNAAGSMTFLGTINDGSLHEALWFSSGSTLSLLARRGDPAPGTSVFFDQPSSPFFPPNTVLTESGLSIFQSSLTGPGVTSSNNIGLWAGTPGDLRLVARTGDPAPGFPAGSVYTSFTFGNSQPEFAADNQGNVAFRAVINGGTIALMLTDLRGHTRPLLVPGLPVTLDATPNETIVSYSIISTTGSPASGRPTFLNEAGQLAAYLRTFSPSGSRESIVRVALPPPCYANCDLSLTPPILNVNDFACFLNRFAEGSAYANCDGSTTPPVLNVQDFGCFLNRFAAGCS